MLPHFRPRTSLCGVGTYVLIAALLPLQTDAGWDASSQQARKLVAKMTKQEKRSMVQGSGWSTFSHPNNGYYIGNTPGIARLGIPALKMYDGPQGWRAGWGVIEGNQLDQVTSWPCGMAVSATWDAARMKQWSAAIATEFLAKGANTILGPAVDLVRVPRYGRNPETIAGEDPFFASVMAVAYVEGVQAQGVIATMKHFIGNNQETNRHFYNSIVDQRTLWEVYYAPYEAAIRKANLGAVMCAYNRVLGKHACEQSSTLQADLKETMGFNGWVMTDWWAAHNADASRAGLDQVMPGYSQGNSGKSADFAHTAADVDLDNMVMRMLTPMIEHGLFQEGCVPPGCDKLLYSANASYASHHQLAFELASESVVLLKNTGVLPIGDNVAKLVIVGSACHAPNKMNDLLWNQGNYYAVGGSGHTLSSRTRSIADGVLNRAASTAVEVELLLDNDLEGALSKSADADLVLICGGVTSGEDQDRENLFLDQHTFIQDFLKESHVPTVVAMALAGPVVITDWKDDAAAIAAMFLGGEATGDAWAAVLFGDVNPGGKLPVTFPVHEDEAIPLCPSTGDCVYSEKLEIGYRGISLLAVDYPFGHGLSYTTFQYAWDVEPSRCKRTLLSNATVCMAVTVENTGAVAGAEVVQLYLRFPEALGEPERVLKGFKKVYLEAGESKAIYLTISNQELSVWDPRTRRWSTASGDFMALVGSSSKDIRLVYTFHHEGEISESPQEDQDFPEGCPENSFEACKMKCAASEDMDAEGVETCELSVCAQRCGLDIPEFNRHPKRGCSNLDYITISRFDSGQGNCRAFCAREAECRAYQIGRTDGGKSGDCVLIRDGCKLKPNDGYDVFLSMDGKADAPVSLTDCRQCWSQEGQNGEDNACSYWCARAVEEGCDSLGCSSTECDFCADTAISN